jgi:protein-disulfide isomerase
LFRIRLLLISILLLALGCSAQSNDGKQDPNALNRRIEQKVRMTFGLPPAVSISVGARAASEMPGYDKVPVTLSSGTHTSTHEFLISKDDKTLIEWEKLDLTQDVMQSIDLNGRPVRGNKEAKVVIVNYDDFECPFCSRMHQTLFPNLLKSYGDEVKIVYKDYPLVEIHPWAMHAAIDANCLAAQNNDAYWDFADYAHNNQKEINGQKRDVKEADTRLDNLTRDIGQKRNLDLTKLDACTKSQNETAVRASMAEGEKIGVDATPTMFVNGERLSGVMPEDDLRKVINQALKDAGETPPATTSAAKGESK